MRVIKKWTKAEQRHLYKCLEKYPTTEAFRVHAKKYKRKVSVVREHFSYIKSKGELPKELLEVITYSHEGSKWSEKEIKILLKEVEKNPGNLEEAYRRCSEKINRTKVSIAAFFLRYRKKEDAKVCMFIAGRKRGAFSNRKIIRKYPEGTTSSMKVSIWNKILKALSLK